MPNFLGDISDKMNFYVEVIPMKSEVNIIISKEKKNRIWPYPDAAYEITHIHH